VSGSKSACGSGWTGCITTMPPQLRFDQTMPARFRGSWTWLGRNAPFGMSASTASDGSKSDMRFLKDRDA
jgi:hypothetical protein